MATNFMKLNCAVKTKPVACKMVVQELCNCHKILSNQADVSANTANPDQKEQSYVTGYRLGISYTCTALRYKPAFIATWWSACL